jgi:hypothetical protein
MGQRSTGLESGAGVQLDSASFALDHASAGKRDATRSASVKRIIAGDRIEEQGIARRIILKPDNGSVGKINTE